MANINDFDWSDNKVQTLDWREEVDHNLWYIRLTFTSDMLGTVPKDKEVYASYIASQEGMTDERIAEEVSTVPEPGPDEEKGWTGFHTNKDGESFIYNYMITGYMKAVTSAMRLGNDKYMNKLRAHNKRINGGTLIRPNRIYFETHGQEMPPPLERPLRAQTPQGERVALARSDVIPAGSIIMFELYLIKGLFEDDFVHKVFAYGNFAGGLGQWRNAGYGRFSAEVHKVK